MTTSNQSVWHIVTGEYPPDRGGVADYTEAVAHALAETGSNVHIWAPGNASGTEGGPSGVSVHRVAGRLGIRGLARMDRGIGGFVGDRRVLIQYTPHAFGWKAMNLPFALWAGWRAFRGDEIRVMFHEVAFPWTRRPLRHNILAAMNRGMAAVMLQACTRAYVSIPGWKPLLRRLGAGRLPIAWTPVPSNVPEEVPADAVAARRVELTRSDLRTRVVCHFGTYGPMFTRILAPIIRELLDRRPEVRMLLLGVGGERWRDQLVDGRPEWLDRVVAPGPLRSTAIAECLRASDFVLQPYPDGASGRRTTLMAALANGVPAITTIGALSEPFWRDGAVAVAPAGDQIQFTRLALDLLDQPDRLTELGRAGRRLYEQRFSMRHTIKELLETP